MWIFGSRRPRWNGRARRFWALARVAVRAGLDAYSELRAGLRRDKAAQAMEEGRRLWLQLKPFTGDDLRESVQAPVYREALSTVILFQEAARTLTTELISRQGEGQRSCGPRDRPATVLLLRDLHKALCDVITIPIILGGVLDEIAKE
jgi:hypothetical protein